MPQTPPTHPTYAQQFRCTGAKCDDTCCSRWTVPVDQPTLQRLEQLPQTPLQRLILNNIERLPEGAAHHARIRHGDDQNCPMLSHGLCRIHAVYGHDFLPKVCADYPRYRTRIDDLEELTLSLSCPEAARQVLFSPDLFAMAEDTVQPPIPQPPSWMQRIYEQPLTGSTLLLAYFWPIRETVLSLMQRRSYPLWQRLFLLGVFCRRLDAIARGELERTLPQFLADFAESVQARQLASVMDTLPADPLAQMDVLLRLAGLMLGHSHITPRFQQTVAEFTSGIGNGPQATLASLSVHHQIAIERVLDPFLERHPQVLENYLVNTILRTLFPFGKENGSPGTRPDLGREFAVLVAQFVLMRGLLAGVAGYHGRNFGAEHVVRTVQAASKHFEHHPEFLNRAHALLVESGMDGARGLALLLRTSPPAPAPTPSAQTTQPARQSVESSGSD